MAEAYWGLKITGPIARVKINTVPFMELKLYAMARMAVISIEL